MKISVVTTLFHSAPYVQLFYRQTVEALARLPVEYELIFVNDGSPDNSLDLVLALQREDQRVVAVDLSRNFGHHRAIVTGLTVATGDLVFLIDSDLEESPELLALYWQEMRANPGADVVYGIQESRKGKWLERITGRIWYRLFSWLSDIDYPTDSLTARLMTRPYVDAVLQHREKELDIWGIFVLAGFSQRALTVSKGSKGTSTYTLRRKLKMMVDSITSFSSKPLIYIFLLGLGITAASGAVIVYLIVMRFVYEEMVEGWASTLISVWFLGGVILFALGIIGLYLSKMFLEIKNRPLTIIRKIYRK
jgi:putative glycosyltransferase